jgi:Skp family chaperone for outer membrane proteins
MLAITALLSCLFQTSGATPPHQSHSIVDCRRCVEDEPSATESYSAERAEEQELAQRFNRLLRALTDFSHSYNLEGVIDVKKVKAVRKALRELEKTEWFSQKNERSASR